MTSRLRINLAYDGSGLCGWAKQPGRPSVAGALEDALSLVLRCQGKQLAFAVAGRTDAGVHAIGQVCHVDVADTVRLPGDDAGWEKLTRRINGALGHSQQIVVHGVGLAPPGFHARYSPLARHYRYLIADREAIRDPRERFHTLWLENSLDVDQMNHLAAALVGLHDWATFCRARAGATTIRELQSFSWRRHRNGVVDGGVVADAFCHSMVRSLVGAAVAVGIGRCSVEEVLDARDRAQRGSLWKTMAARGLTLEKVIYPPNRELLARQRDTRDRRSLASD